MTETLTRAGLAIPLIGLGTWDLDQKKCSRVVSEALDLGYRHIDAAAMYENESQVGAGIIDSKIDREELFLTTKINTTSWTPSGGSGPLLQNKNIIQSFEKSLLDLKTDYVDLLLIHWPRFETNLADMLEIMYEIKDSQKAKEIGVANFNSNLLKECVNFGFNDLFCNQVEYHPFLSQSKLLDTMKSLDIIPVAYCPICRGDVAKDDVIINLSEKYSKTPAQIALRWVVQQNAVAIPKTANLERLKENSNIYDFNLDEGDMEQIFALQRNQRLVPNLESNESLYPWD